MSLLALALPTTILLAAFLPPPVLAADPSAAAATHVSTVEAGTLPPCPAGSKPEGSPPPIGLERRCVDTQGRAQGTWLNWYESGRLMSERQMRDDREHGLQRSWWPNGQLMMEGVSMDGQRVQGFRYWSISGEPTKLPARTRQAPPATTP